MDPFQHRNFKPWANFLRKHGFSAFIQIRSENGSVFQSDINNHPRNTLTLDKDLGVDTSTAPTVVTRALPRLPCSFSLLVLEDDLVVETASNMIISLLHDGQQIGDVST